MRAQKKLRPVVIEPGVLKYAEGSSLITMGDTKVLCSATVSNSVPPFLTGTQTGWITAEYSMLPRSTKTRTEREQTRGRTKGRTQEIQRMIGRALRAVVDFKNLGERTVTVDCDVIQADGGTRCASITGGYVALVLAQNYLMEKGLIEKPFILDYVAAVSVGIIDGKIYLDLDYELDSKADVDMNVVMSGRGRLVEIQGTAERKSFSEEELMKMLKVAKTAIKELIKIQKKVLEKI